jgi:hypothetical protein
MTLYRVLRPAPLTERTGEVTYDGDQQVVSQDTTDQQIRWHRVTSWPELGTIQAKSAEQAIRMAREEYGGRCALEEIQEPIYYVG